MSGSYQFPEDCTVKTYVPKQGEIIKNWHVIDAEGQVLGRVAAAAAALLRGKHKAQYTPYLDCGDHVIVINAEKARVTGAKELQKKYYRHSGYPGGIKEINYGALREKHPARAMENAIRGMLPHNRLGRQLATHFRVYAGPKHPHEAQNPQPYAI
jgi:large subunit ribosomal protein L13